MGLQLLIKSPVMAVWALMKIIGKSGELSLVTGTGVIIIVVTNLIIISIVSPRFQIIQNLTEEIKETENLLERYRNDLRNAEIEVNKMATSERNLKLINVLRDKHVIESKLPSLYNKQRELSNAVSDKYSELQKYEDSLREYDEVLNEIEAIEREINNQ